MTDPTDESFVTNGNKEGKKATKGEGSRTKPKCPRVFYEHQEVKYPGSTWVCPPFDLRLCHRGAELRIVVIVAHSVDLN